MAADSSTPPDGDSEPRLSWRDRELLTALRRVANSRAQVQSLEAARAEQVATRPADPADAERVHALEDELVKLRAKAGGRFGGGAARDRIPEVEMQQRLVLERLGYDSYDTFVAAEEQATPVAAPVDAALFDFARRELAAAEEAYEQLLAMPDDEDDALPPSRSRQSLPTSGRGPASGTGPTSTIDLTGGETSA